MSLYDLKPSRSNSNSSAGVLAAVGSSAAGEVCVELAPVAEAGERVRLGLLAQRLVGEDL